MAYPYRVTNPAVGIQPMGTPVRTSMITPSRAGSITLPPKPISRSSLGVNANIAPRSESSAEMAGALQAQQASLQAMQAKVEALEQEKILQAQQASMQAMQAKVEALEQERNQLLTKMQSIEDENNMARKALIQAQSANVDASQRKGSKPMCDVQSFIGQHDIIGRVPMEELDHHYDVVVIGGGPVGVAAAMKAAVLGHRSIIVDKPKLSPMPNGLDPSFGGPTGLYSKALRDTGKHVDVVSLQSMHLDDEVIWHQVRNMCLRLACSNASHQVNTLKKFKISYLQASATVVSANDVLVNQEGNGDDPTILQTDYVLVATGSKPMRPKEIPFDDMRIFDSDSINSLSFLPKSVAVLGAGIIAIEYAKIFRKLGATVYMLVRSDCLTALERIGLDHDIAEKLIEVLHADDVSIYENTSVVQWDIPASRADGPLTLELKSKSSDVPSHIQVEVFFAACGRVANTKGWGAEKLGIKLTKKGHLEVSNTYETSVPGIYAAGDVIGPPSLASTGVYQAQAAMLEMFGQGHMNKFDSFPVGMWTTPECGYYGLTLAEAVKKGMDVKEGTVGYDACLRGRVFAPVGLLKLVFRVEDGVIVGVHILGDDACELVHYGMDLVKQEVSIFKVMTTCFTAVTYHELFREAALDGNSQLEFGLEWHKILTDIGTHIDNHEHGLNLDEMKRLFNEADKNGDGLLDSKDLMDVFHKYGCNIDRATAANLVRLSSSTEEAAAAVHWDDFRRIFDILEEVRSNSHFAKEEQAPEEVSQSPSAKRRFGSLRSASKNLHDVQDLVKVVGA